MDLQPLLFSFAGRINRAKYWFVVLITFIISMVAVIFALTMISALGEAGYMVAIAIGIAVFVFSVWIGIAAGVKRLHDREKSGWWLLLFYLVPSVLNGMSTTMSDTGRILVALVGFVISVWGFVELACLKGTTGANTYGADPLAATS